MIYLAYRERMPCIMRSRIMPYYRLKNDTKPCEIVSRNGDLVEVEFLDGIRWRGVHVSHLREIPETPEAEGPDHTCSVCGIALEPWESIRCAGCHSIEF
jgi:hypothetical protein